MISELNMENATSLSVDPNIFDIEKFTGSLFPEIKTNDKWISYFIGILKELKS